MPSPYAFAVDGEVLFDPEPKQLEVMQAAASGKWPNLLVWGNRGGGKSVTARFLAHGLALKHKGLKYVIVRRSYPELQKTHLAFLDDEMRKLGGSFNKTEHIARYPNGSLGFYAQCDTDSDVRKVLGAEAAIIIFDEAPELEWEWMVMIGASIRAPKNSGFPQLALYLGNPIGASVNQIWQYFIEKDVDPADDPEYCPDDWHAIELRLEDNSHLDAKSYVKRFSGLPAHVIKAWRDGERVIERALFQFKPTIAVEETRDDGSVEVVRKPYHVIDELPLFEGRSILEQPWVQIYRAFDMGFYPDPAYCLWLAVFGRQVIAFHEQVWLRTIAKDIARQIRETTRDILPDGRHVVITHADPTIGINTGADVVTIQDTFEMSGVPVELSVNRRDMYAHAIHSALQEEVAPHTPRLRILRKGCPYLIKALPMMRYDEKDPMKMADHKHDHPPITLAYHLLSSGSLATTQPESRAQRPAWMKEFMPRAERHVLGRDNVAR